MNNISYKNFLNHRCARAYEFSETFTHTHKSAH